MKREILFRGKRIDNGQWVYGNFYHQLVSMGSIAIIRSGYDVDNQVHWGSIGQYTGITDKNGNKIFEGDVLQIPGYYCEVKFIDGMFVSVYNHPEDGETLPLSELGTDRFTIIGNIYENVK